MAAEKKHPPCVLCEKPVEDAAKSYCYGCGSHVCVACSINDDIPFEEHDPEDHAKHRREEEP